MKTHWLLWAFLDCFPIQINTMNGILRFDTCDIQWDWRYKLIINHSSNNMLIPTFHGSSVLCVLLGSLFLLSWRQQFLRLWWGPLPDWSETAGLLCEKLAPYSHWNKWWTHNIWVSQYHLLFTITYHFHFNRTVPLLGNNMLFGPKLSATYPIGPWFSTVAQLPWLEMG